MGIRELEWRALSLYPGGKGQGGKEARRADTRREREEAMHERMRALRDPGTGGRVSDRRGNPETPQHQHIIRQRDSFSGRHPPYGKGPP